LRIAQNPKYKYINIIFIKKNKNLKALEPRLAYCLTILEIQTNDKKIIRVSPS